MPSDTCLWRRCARLWPLKVTEVTGTCKRWCTASSLTVPLTYGNAGPPPGLKWPQCSCYPERQNPKCIVVLGKLQGTSVGTWTVHKQRWHTVGCMFMRILVLGEEDCRSATIWCPYVFQHYLPYRFCLSSCLSSCLSVSLLRHILLEPGGQGGNVFGLTREHFILGTEVLQAVISLKQHPSGSGEAVRHHHYKNWNRLTGQAGWTHNDQWDDVKTFHNDNNYLWS